MPETSATAAQIAARDTHYDAHLLAIEGLPYLWTDDETGELLGSGAASWIGASEAAIGETVGQRIVLPGLRMPRSLREAIDPKIGILQAQSATFTLVDYEGILASLFATEGKPFSILGEDIQPGVDAMGTSVAVSGGLTVNPRGRYIGLERIGPAGERAYFPPVPSQWIGRHHPVNLYGQGEEGPRPIPVSLSPLDFTNRRVCVYRLVRRELPAQIGYGAWPLWNDQYDAGRLEWWGSLTDKGTITGNREWQLKCTGALSWVQRSLNQWAPGWAQISDAVIELSEAERQVAIQFNLDDESVVQGPANSIGFTTVLTASGTKDLWISELRAFVSDVATGVQGTYGSTNWSDFRNATASILDDGTIAIRRDPITTSGPTAYTDAGAVGMSIAMSETAWRAIGFDPPLQSTDTPFSEETQIYFLPLSAGQNVFGTSAVDGETPAEGFWLGLFNSLAVGLDGDTYTQGLSSQGSDNWGHDRYWRPVNNGGLLILGGPAYGGPQTLRLAFDQPYLESEQSVPRSDALVAGSEVTHARYFALRGKRSLGIPVGPGTIIDASGAVVALEDVEPQDYGAMIRGEWRQPTGGYGALIEDDGRPTLVVARWEDGRLGGIPFAPAPGEWAAIASQEEGSGIEIAPLLTYGYGTACSLGRAIECFYQLLLSTGTAEGFDEIESEDPQFLAGLNTHPGQSQAWCWDALRADHGLAVPYEFVASPDELVAEWDRVPGGDGGALSRVGLAYVGPQESQRVIESLLRPRALSMSLDGGRYGVVYLAPFSPFEAAASIGVDDLWGPLDTPSSVIPDQQLRAMGQLDRTELDYRYNPLDGDTQIQATYRARDREAHARRGDLKVELVDHGLIPGDWKVPGVNSWSLSFRELWEVERAEFFARRHFLVTNLTVNRIRGQSTQVGTRVLLTNPWPVNPAGTAGESDAQGYGLTDACGFVIDRTWNVQERSYTLSVLVFAGQHTGARVFAPIGRMASQAGAAITLEAEDASRGLSGAGRFDRPSFTSAQHAQVRFLSHDRRDWHLSGVYTIASVAGNVVTLTGTPTASDVYPDRDTYLILAEDSQQAGRWPRSYCSPIVLDSLQHPGGQGYPLEP